MIRKAASLGGKLMGDGVERQAKRAETGPVARPAAVAEIIAGFPSGVNHYNLPVEVPPGCVLASTLELPYYPSKSERVRAGRQVGGHYWHVPVGSYERGGGEKLDLVLIIPVAASISDEDGLIYAELIREALGVKRPEPVN